MARTKKEFSKEAMYKKIMPSMLRGTEENNEKKNDINNSNLEENINDEIDNNIEAVDDKNTRMDEKSIIIDEEINTVHSSREDIVNNNYEDEKTTVNLVEMLVRDKLESVLDKFKCCKCQLCKNDIVVIALNNLSVFYFSGNKKEIEEALSEFKLSNNIDVVTEIIKAIIIVRKKEKH